MEAGSSTRMLLVTLPEWGHLSPFLHLADSIQRNWDTSSRGKLQLSIASMEQVRTKIEARGIDFVSIGAWEKQEQEEYERCSRASFDPNVSFLEKMRLSSTGIMSMLGIKMGTALVKHLQAAKDAGNLPDVIVTDGLTSAGFDAAEVFQLPLAVIWPFPLSMCLMLAGYAGHNLPSDVPLEFLSLNSHEDAHPFVRNVLNPLLKRLVVTFTNVSFGGSRRRVRKQLGLPPLSPPALRNKNGSSSGVLNRWAGQMAAQPVIPRVIYLAGVSWEMNAVRELPPCWHMVGPLVVDRYSSDFPPKFGPEDAAVEVFLQDAADAGEAVVFTAAGSMTHLTQQQVDALVENFEQLASGGAASGGRGVRVLWALRADVQHLLPPHLRSNAATGGRAAPAANAAAAADPAPDSTSSTTSSSSIGSQGRILVASWVKQTAVLAHPATEVFVTHGGLGSVHECLALGQAVPLVVPFSNGADHVTIGQQLVNRGLGVMLKPAELRHKGKLLRAVQGLLADGQYRERVADVAQKWEKAGYGPNMAAEMLSDFATAGTTQTA